MKIWDCGEWKPILGYNSTAANKIDCVENNTQYHPAIFTGQNPNDISDNGSLGELLADSNYVNEQEWEDIFNTEQFQQAFNTQVIGGDNYDWTELIKEIIEEGDIIKPAESNVIGGIWADEFGSSTHASGSHDDYLAQAKYKYGHGKSDYNLYVHAKDIVKIINKYTTEHDDTSLEVQLATYDKIGGINAQTDSDASDYRGLPVVFGGPNVGLTFGGSSPYTLYGDSVETNPNNSFLYVPGWALRDWLNNPTHSSGNTDPIIVGRKGVSVVQPTGSDLLYAELSNIDSATEGYVPTKKTTGGVVDILWQPLPSSTVELATPSALGGILSSTHKSIDSPRQAGIEVRFAPLNGNLYDITYGHQIPQRNLSITGKQVVDVINDYLNQTDSDEWDVNLKASYGIVVRKETFTDDDNNQIVSYTHSLSNYGQFTKERMYCRTKFYNQSTPGVQNRDYSYNDTHGLEWISGLDIITDALNVTESTNGFLKCTDGYFSFDQAAGGESYPTLSSDSQSNVDYVVKGGGTAGTYLDHNGQWTTPPNTQYQVFSTSVNGLVPKPNSASSKLFLNSAGGWSAPQLSVDTFNGLNSGLVPQPVTSSSKYFLDATGNWSTPGTGSGGSGSNFSITMAQSIQASGNYTISNQTIDNTQSGFNRILIDEWSYYNLDAGDSRDVSITFSNTHVSGNAIYIRVNTGGYQVSIDVGSTDIIYSNGVFGASKNTLSSNSSYLFTIQFGIIKVEIISASKSSGGSEEQLSGNGGN